jgi:uncharacterized RDD family membrane protein YckC
MFYDLLLLTSIYFFSTLVLLPFNSGQPIEPGNLPYDIYLMVMTYLYFTWQWTHGGQTLGMRAWKIRLRQHDGGNVTWHDASLRFLLALLSGLAFGTGFFLALIKPERMAFHDRYSNTRLYLE